MGRVSRSFPVAAFMRSPRPLVLAIGLVVPRLASADPSTAPQPAAAPPALAPKAVTTRAPIPMPPAEPPLVYVGAAAIIGALGAVIALATCGADAAPMEDQCLEASGISALGLLAVGIPSLLIGRQQAALAAWNDHHMTVTASAHRVTVGLTF